MALIAHIGLWFYGRIRGVGRPIRNSSAVFAMRNCNNIVVPENCRGIPSEADHCPWL